MAVLRTLFWVVLTAALVAFMLMNWTIVQINWWPTGDGKYLHFEGPLGAYALVIFLAGLLPMWLRHRFTRWSAGRRIATLENSLRAAAPAPPIATSTQLDAAQQQD